MISAARVRFAALAFTFFILLSTATLAQALTPAAPNDGQVFSWEDVEYDGIEFIVHGPPGLFLVDVEISRDATFPRYPESAMLSESSPGVYRGTALAPFFDERTDAGTYFWRPYYYGGPAGVTYGIATSFVLRPLYRAPSLRIVGAPRIHAGQRSSVVLQYRPGSQSQADRLHLLAASRCPDAPGGRAPGALVSDAEAPSGGRIAVAMLRRSLGRMRLCGYVTADGVVTRRAARTVEVVRPPVSRRQMGRWRLSSRGLGPIKIGMTIDGIERATGRSAVFSYGDYPSCQLWSLRGARGLSLMRSYGRVARIEAYGGHWRSSRGVRIGDPERKVISRYGVVHTKPHPYTSGKYLIVGPHRRRMIFETNSARKVTSFRGGRAPHIGYIEGCV